MRNLKWMCLTPLQVNESMHSWERIKNHILGIWNHSDFSIDISKLHQDIQNMKQVESDFSSQWLFKIPSWKIWRGIFPMDPFLQ